MSLALKRKKLIFLQEAFIKIIDDVFRVDELIALTMETGKFGVAGMAVLNEANTTTYGNPEITKVDIGVGDKPGILISGHDLKDLEMLLQQTENQGVDVKKLKKLAGHFYSTF